MALILAESFKSLYNISKELSQRGYDVTIITTDYKFDGKYKESIEKEGVKVVTFKCKFNLGLFLITPSMKDWLEKNIQNYDIIHMHTFRSSQNNIIHKFAKKYGVPYILHAHGSLTLKTGKANLKRIYDFVWGYNLLKDASKVIALTKAESEDYISMGVDENLIEIIPNFIDLSQYSNLPLKGNFKLKYDIDKNKKLILYLGQIHKIKGIDLLVEAFAELLESMKNVELAIVGPDSGFLVDIKNQIKKLGIDKKVFLTGPIYGKDKLAAYVDADVFVLPSIHEGFPNTILESCACETSVIVTKTCNIDFIDKVGYEIDYNKEQLKNSLILSLKEGPKHDFIDFNKIVSEFSIDNTLNKIELIYVKLGK